jgi:hypothetical protein
MLRRIFAVVAGFSLLTGCTSAVSHAYVNKVTTTVPEATTGTSPPAPIAFRGAGFDVHTAGTVSQATFDATWAGVLATLNRYLEAAVLTPLRTGGPAGDLSPLFTPLAVDRVTTGPDRAAFIDEGVPQVTDLHADAAVARLTALAGADGSVSVVDASVDLRLTAEANGAPVSVTRTGDMVLMPDGGNSGSWRIDAYDITARRTFAGAATTTTARS